MGGLAQVPRDKNKNPFLGGSALVSLDSQSQAAGATAVTLFKNQGGLVMNAQAGDSPAIWDAKLLTIVVGNNATAQTITALSLHMTGQTTSGLTGTIIYAITSDVTGAPVNIASGATQTFIVPLNKGKLPTLSLVPTFGAAPAAGAVETYTTAESAGAALTALSGSTIGGSNSSTQVPTQGMAIAGIDNSGKSQLAEVLGFGGTWNGFEGLVVVAGLVAVPTVGGVGNFGSLKMLGTGSTGVLADPRSGTGSVAITTATTTSVKASGGVLGTIINAGSAASTGTLTVYDNTSATGTPVIVLPTGIAQAQVIVLAFPMGTGITIVTSQADTWRVSYA